ncbi:MAG: hypothetical protein KA138_06605 [Saprospiraceae bacterium]|nr:hypothetical protein [Saprospiraceae bacterium]
MNKTTGANSRFAKAGVSCFYDSEVLNSSFVHIMKFSAKKPRLRKTAKPCGAIAFGEDHGCFFFTQVAVFKPHRSQYQNLCTLCGSIHIEKE